MPDVEVAHGETIVDAGEEVWNWSSPAGKLRLSRRVELFAASTGLGLSKKKVLELGCGTGLYTQQLAPLCGELVAVDISQTLLAEARAKVPSPHVTFVRQNLEDIQPRELGSGFEAVFGCSVLHHLDLEQTLPQLKTILAPGADLAFSEPNLLNPQVRLMFSRLKWARKKWATSDTEMAFYPWELRSIFTRHGFDLAELYPFDFMHPAIPAGAIDFARRVEHTLENNPLTRHFAGSYFIHARYRSYSSAH
jgi:2-polyprenyl-3-methyl-5-hydroxy-6-metoxy-1,4-benzoquinol methylase